MKCFKSKPDPWFIKYISISLFVHVGLCAWTCVADINKSEENEEDEFNKYQLGDTEM